MADDFDDDQVGFKKPPKGTRFQPGHSGNPKGRTKGTRNFKTDLIDELKELIVVRENGRERKISKQRAFIKALVAAAIKSDMRAINAILRAPRLSVPTMRTTNRPTSSTSRTSTSSRHTSIVSAKSASAIGTFPNFQNTGKNKMSELANALKTAIRNDFESFTRKVHKTLRGENLGDDPYIGLACKIGERFADGVTPRVVVNMPPGSAKTTIYSITMTAWLLAHNPRLRIMVVSHDESLSGEITYAVRKIMRSDWYKSTFPTRLAKDRTSAADFMTTKGGRVYASSIYGSITGHRADVVIVDDPVSIKDAGKRNRIRRANEIFDKEIMSRLNEDGGRILLVMHRLSDDDMTAHVLEKGAWKRIALPLVAERTTTYNIGGYSWTREKDEQLRAKLYSKKHIQALKDESGTCPCRKLNPDISVVQSAQDWQRQNAADGLDGAGYWRILVQR